MKSGKKVITLIFLFFLSQLCLSQPVNNSKNANQLNALDILIDLTTVQESNDIGIDDIKNFLHAFDRGCEHEIYVALPQNIDIYFNILEKIVPNDSTLHQTLKSGDDFIPFLSYLEFKFRTVVQAQFRLEELYLALPSLEKISYMIKYILMNKDLSECKTELLLQILSQYSYLDSYREKKRYWQAIDRMLDEIDLQKSETGNQLVQRSPYGIITQPGEILGWLNSQILGEKDEQLRKYASGLYRRIETANSKYKRPAGYEIQIGIPDSIVPEINMGTAADYFEKAYQAKDNQSKIEFYSQSIEANPNFSPAYYNRGIAYYELGKYSEAVRDFDSSLKLEPNSALTYFYRGVCFQELNRLDRAIVSLSCAISLDPKPIAALVNRGICYQKLEKYEQAIDDYSRVLKWDEENLPVLTNRGYCYQMIKEYPKGIEDYKRIIRISPRNESAYYNLGSIYWTQQNWDGVIEVWEKCLEINPSHEQILENLPTAKVNAAYTKKQRRTIIIKK